MDLSKYESLQRELRAVCEATGRVKAYSDVSENMPGLTPAQTEFLLERIKATDPQDAIDSKKGVA